MGGLTNMFSNGQSNGYQDESASYQRGMDQANQYYSPYLQAGQSAIPQYQNWINQMQGQQNGNWMKDYQESPYAKYLTQTETNAQNNAAAGGGLLGSGANQKANMTLANNISSADMQNYFNNMQSQNQMIGGGLNNLMGNGFQGAQGISNLIAQLMTGQGNAQGHQDVANQQAKNSMLGSLTAFGPNSQGSQDMLSKILPMIAGGGM